MGRCVGLSPAGSINRWGSLPSGSPAGVEVPLIGPVRVPAGDEHHITDFVAQVQKGSGGTLLKLYRKAASNSASFVQVDETPIDDYGTRNIQLGSAIRFLETEQWKVTVKQTTPGRVTLKIGGQTKRYDVRTTPAVLPLLDQIYLAGDDFTLQAFAGSVRPNYGEDILAAHPGYSPSWRNGGIAGMTAVTYLASQLAADMVGAMVGFKYIGLCFGLADIVAGNTPTDTIMAILNIVRRLMRAGYTPVVATMPYYSTYASQIAALNNDLRQYATQFTIPAGPDLEAWFLANPSGVGAGTPIIPTAQGAIDTVRLWAQAMDSIYT